MASISNHTGHQWGDDFSYIGPYNFVVIDGNVCLPPNTTTIAPPSGIPAGKEAAWDGSNWIVRDEDLSWME